MRRYLVLCAVFFVAACSSTDEPATEAATASESRSQAETGEGRPDQEAYRDGMNTEVLSQAGISADSIPAGKDDEFFDCLSDASYDAVSDGWVRGISASDVTLAVSESTGNDMTLFANSALQCLDQIATSSWGS